MTDSGVPAYKCALWDGDCYYAERLAGFEERRIVRAEHLELTPLHPGRVIERTEHNGSAETVPEEFE